MHSVPPHHAAETLRREFCTPISSIAGVRLSAAVLTGNELGGGVGRLTADMVVTWKEAAAPSDISLGQVYIGPDPQGHGGFQVAVATSASTPTRGKLRELFIARKGKMSIQLVVAVIDRDTVHLFGPDPHAQAVQLPVDQAERQLQSVLDEPDLFDATERYAGFRKADDSTGVAGFTNSGLFASHHVTQNAPERTDWESKRKRAAPLLSKRGKPLIDALGFGTQPGPNGTMLLTVSPPPPDLPAQLPFCSMTPNSSTRRLPDSSFHR